MSRRSWLRGLVGVPVLAALPGLAGCTPPLAPARPTAPISSTPSTRPAPGARSVADEQSLVDRWVSSVRAGDDAAHRNLIGGADRGFAATADTIWRNLRTLGPELLTVTVTARGEPVSAARRAVLGADAASTETRISWRLVGQTRPAQTAVWLTFTGTDDTVRWSGTTDLPPGWSQPLPIPIWWLERIEVDTTDSVVLIRAQPVTAPERTPWPALAAAVGSQATRRLGRLRTEPVVVQLPGSAQTFARATAQPAARALAGITVPAGPDPATAPAQVVVNPAVVAAGVDRLDLTLTHELVHAVLDAPARPAPMCTDEGTADAVALDAYPALAAAETARLLRELAGRVPTVPDDDAFTPTADDLDHAYALAWTACRFVADRRGWSGLRRLGDRLADDRTIAWWRQVGYDSVAAFERGWADWLRHETPG